VQLLLHGGAAQDKDDRQGSMDKADVGCLGVCPISRDRHYKVLTSMGCVAW
jgi:hypothetical protein